MNLVLITKILQQQNPSIGYSLRMRRNTNPGIGTNIDVRFIIFCFAFIETGNSDTFWRWIERERHLPRVLRDMVLRYRNTETSNCHSLAFVDLLRLSGFMNAMKEVVTLLRRAANLGQFINTSFSWSEQPEGHTYWATLNSRIDNLYRFFRNQPHPQDMLFPDYNISQMRQQVHHAVGVLWERNVFNNFLYDYEALENERSQRQLEEFHEILRGHNSVGENTERQPASSLDEYLDSLSEIELPDFEITTASTPRVVSSTGGLYYVYPSATVSSVTDNHT